MKPPRSRWMLLSLLIMAMPAVGAGPGAQPPIKPASVQSPSPPSPAVLRQGGDTIADAVHIDLPVSGLTGSTVGYTDDYDEVCPYSGSTSSDVVYRLTMAVGYQVVIDLWGSTYDTKVYVYDANLVLLGCNDDFYDDYVSRLEVVLPVGDAFIVIDGYGGDAGDYCLNIDTIGWPILGCPPDGVVEGEPPLDDEHIDVFNGGCDSLDLAGVAPMQPLNGPVFCGNSGYFQRQGNLVPDTDWFTIQLPSSGSLTIRGRADWFTTLQHVGPQDCGTVGVLQSVVLHPFSAEELTVTGAPGEVIWLRVAPDQELDLPAWLYVLELPPVVAVESQTWSAVKGLFE